MKLKKQRKKENEELLEAQWEDNKRKSDLDGQIYDGRQTNKKTQKKEGYTLRVGDRIRYWGAISSLPGAQHDIIETTIIRCYDLYHIKAESFWISSLLIFRHFVDLIYSFKLINPQVLK